MRGINFLAGLGTILIFIGIFCFKTAFNKVDSRDKENRVSTYLPKKRYTKFLLPLIGCLCVILGGLLIAKALHLV